MKSKHDCSLPRLRPSTNHSGKGAHTNRSPNHFTVSTYSHSRYAVHAVRATLHSCGYYALRVSSPDTAIDLVAWNDSRILLIAAHTVRNHLDLREIALKYDPVISSLRKCPATRYTGRELFLLKNGCSPRIVTVYPGGLREIENPAEI